MLSLFNTKYVFEQPPPPRFHFIHVRILCSQFVLYRTIKCSACVCYIIRGQVQVLLLRQYCLVVFIQYKWLKTSWGKIHWKMPYVTDSLSSVAYAQRIAIFGSHQYLLKLLVLSIRKDVGPRSIVRLEQSV
jgi:hypothetical protein